MTFKNLLSVAAAAALMTSSAVADVNGTDSTNASGPVINLNLLRDPVTGLPVVDSATNGLTYIVSITPDDSVGVFSTGAGTLGPGGSTAVELGFTVGGAGLASQTLSTTLLPVGAADPVVVNLDDTPGSGSFGTNSQVTGADTGVVEFANPGNQIFDFEVANVTTDNGDRIGGVQIDGNRVFAALGTTFFNAADDGSGGFEAGGPYELLRIKTGPLDSTPVNGTDPNPSLSPSLTLLAQSIVAQSLDLSATPPQAQAFTIGSDVTDSDSVLPGDANLDGVVNFQDFGALSGNFNSTTAIWSQADFNNDGTVNFQDFGVLSGNFNASGTAPAVVNNSVVPEPSSLVLAAVALSGVVYPVRRRHSRHAV